MSKVATAAASRRSTKKLDSEEREMQSIEGRGVAHPAKLGAAKKVGTAKTEAAPSPGRPHFRQEVSEEAGKAAYPWRVQPRRQRKSRAGADQRPASEAIPKVTEAAS